MEKLIKKLVIILGIILVLLFIQVILVWKVYVDFDVKVKGALVQALDEKINEAVYAE